jgi:uncharacterized protein YdeI (YjbR/CyaY-like superfamily)
VLRLDRQPGATLRRRFAHSAVQPAKVAQRVVESNVERVQRLIEAGRMRQAGQREIDAAKADGRWPTA